MKKIYFVLLAVAMMAVSSCHKPEFIESDANRQGLTSLTAIFTFGPFVDQEMAKLVIDDDSIDEFVIPIPWFYPMTSDDVTSPYMTKVRVQAELAPNFKLEPALTILDLTEDNYFTYTDPKGRSRKINITGERVKSSECDILSFVLQNPTISGVVNKETKTITLPTKDDLKASTATVMLSAHATISPDPATKRSYNGTVEYTVTAHDGVTKQTYVVEKGDPEKIDMGIADGSIEKLFNFDPVSRLGMPAYTESVAPSLASIEGYLVVCLSNGTAPVYLNGLTGDKLGTIKIGSANPGSIANDELEHMLITNVALGNETVNIYKTSSVKTDPELFYSFVNPQDCPIGHKMKIFGNIEADAVITLTAEGIEGVTTTAKAVYLTVTGGEVVSVDVVDFSSLGFGWGPAPVNTGTIVPASLNPANDGWFLDYYESNSDADGNYLLHYISPKMTDTIISRIGNWANNPNCLDAKTFNNVRYMTLFVVSHFPQWGIAPQLYLYNISDPESAAPIFSKESISWYQNGAAGIAAGDVTIAPSADGYKVFVYYYDHNAQVVGGYSADCIKR